MAGGLLRHKRALDAVLVYQIAGEMTELGRVVLMNKQDVHRLTAISGNGAFLIFPDLKSISPDRQVTIGSAERRRAVVWRDLPVSENSR
jgi:hypothetical protein